jgi:pimeloyl-ACP methyl ester carboxylesterase
MTAVISLHTEHGCGVLLTAHPGHRWKDRLTSVCIPPNSWRWRCFAPPGTSPLAPGLHLWFPQEEISMPTIRTKVLDIAFEEGGPRGGPPVLLLHGWPDDVREWRTVTPYLEEAGFHWVAPWLRGFGNTRFLSTETLRDGSGVALTQDAIDFADAIGFERFSVIGHDWGARTAYTLAALWPQRIASIVALSLSYSPGGRFPTPTFEQSRRWWYQWFMATEPGAAAVRKDPIGFAREQWNSWGPVGWFTDTEFKMTAESFNNPDWTPITLHAYRSRWKSEPADELYLPLKSRLASVETIQTPTLMIQGEADNCNPPSESADQARHFTGSYERVLLAGVGHFPAREAPGEVARVALAHLKMFV